MDPKSLTSLDWNNISVIVHTLWIILISIVVFGGTFLIAHIFIPGMNFTKFKSGQLKVLRLLLYVISGAAFAIAAFLTIRTFSHLSSVLSFYSRLWM